MCSVCIHFMLLRACVYSISSHQFFDFSAWFCIHLCVILGGQTVFLFVLGLSFHSYRHVTITSEGPQTLTYARHSSSLSSERYKACHTNCDTGHPFIMVISVSSGAVTTCFNDLGLWRLGLLELPTFRLRGQRSIWTLTESFLQFLRK